MGGELVCRRFLLCAVVCVAIGDAAVIGNTARADGPPPVVTVGTVTDPTGAAQANGEVGSNGQTAACVNDTNSGVDPNGASSTGTVAHVADAGCGSTGAAPPSATAGSSRSASGNGSARATGGSANAGASAATSVAAESANGVVIARVTPIWTGSKLRVVVTVRDLGKRLIRNAAVAVRPMPGRTPTLRGTSAGFTNAFGRASFPVTVPAKLRGKRLRFLVTARTPTAHTTAIGSAQARA